VITAWDHFDQTVREHPDWPYARLGLARAALASNRSLALNDPRPGQYELVITVDEVATGRRVVRRRTISVGAT
jgi:hypothetical protein